MIRKYAYGLLLLTVEFIGLIPSQFIRNLFYLYFVKIKLSKGVVIYRGARIRGGRKISIGEGTSIGDRCDLDGRGGLTFGCFVNISTEVMFWTSQHNFRTEHFPTVFAPVFIEDYVWIGPRSIVLPGVTVAEGCIVAAGAVVTKSTQPYGVYAGIPAERIGERPKLSFTYRPGYSSTPFL